MLWYGLHMGLSYEETMSMPLGDLKTLVAIQQIKLEGMEPKVSDTDAFFDILSVK